MPEQIISIREFMQYNKYSFLYRKNCHWTIRANLEIIAPILDKSYLLIVLHPQTSNGHNYPQKNSLLYVIL